MAVPLIAIAFVWSLRLSEERRILYATIAYAAAAAAILLPLSSRLFFTDDHSLTLLGLSYGVIVHLSSPPIGSGLRSGGARSRHRRSSRYRHGYAVSVAAGAVCIVAGLRGSLALIDLQVEDHPPGERGQGLRPS